MRTFPNEPRMKGKRSAELHLSRGLDERLRDRRAGVTVNILQKFALGKHAAENENSVAKMGADERKHYRRGFALHLCIVVSGLSPACDTPLERRSRAGIQTLRHSHVHNVQFPPVIGKPWERRSRRLPSRSRPQPDRNGCAR